VIDHRVIEGIRQVAGWMGRTKNPRRDRGKGGSDEKKKAIDDS
jgi:hypothetical protein